LLSDTSFLSHATWKRWTILLASACALFFLYFFGLTRTGMLGPDEPRYAAIGQAMARTGDWITPRLWEKPWFEKPPLLYWLTAAAFKAGLGKDMAPRLPVALFSVGFLIYFFVALHREFGEHAAFYATAVLATSAGWLAFSHIAVTDLPMSAAFAAAMLIVIRIAIVSRGLADESVCPTLSHNGLRLRGAGAFACQPVAAGVLLGLAVLAKGLVPLALFLPAVWFLRGRLRGLLVILATAAAVALPWYAAVTSINGPAFLQEFFWKHHLERYITGALLHERPFWFYLPVLVAGLFPWSPCLLLLFSKPFYSDRRVRFLAAWFAWGFIFFSLSRNKLPGYLLPLLPPLAALLGIALSKAQAGTAKMVALMATSAALLGFVPAIQDLLPQSLLHGFSRAQFHLPLVWILPAIAIIVASMFLERTGHRGLAITLVSMVIVLSVARLVWQTYPELDQKVSPRGFWVFHGGSITCSSDSDRGRHYGLNYYAGRNIPDCD
jgi:4-amino-4-deoxy-L-arabinose transferase-like glycosyltransferase